MSSIPLPDNVIITHQIKNDLQGVLAKKDYSRVVVLVDSNTNKVCYPKLNFALPPHELIEMDAGEENKNLWTCTKVWEALTELKIDRKGLMIVLGGGVAGDLGGFCAATYKRGIDFVLIPTTLLAQVDASVGGKLGIDFDGLKNHIGVFQDPVATIIFTGLLNTLPVAELRSGFAEVIKHCLLSDKAMWNVIRKKSLANQDWSALVAHSVAFKSAVVKADPRESGMRKILNFGHTIGHALESYHLSTFNRLLHGEAIAIGMVAESRIAQKKGLMTENELNEIKSYIIQIFGKVELPDNKSVIVRFTLQDKKNVGDKIQIAVPKGIGGNIWDIETSMEEIQDALDYYRT